MPTVDTPLRPAPLAIRTVLVATDGSPGSEPAYLAAMWFATRLGAAVELVSVASEDELIERASAIARTLPGRPVTKRRVIVGDDLVDELSIAIGCGDGVLGCMSTRARSRSAPVLGSTAASVLDRTWSPLLLVGPRAGAARHAGPVVVALSGDPGDDDLLGVGAAWSDALCRPLVLVTVAEPVPASQDGHHHRALGPDEPDAYLSSLADRLVTAERPSIDVAFDPVSVVDGLAPLLERLAPSLVVVGHRSHGAVHRVLAGDHTAAVVRIAPAPVLAVPLGLHR